MKTSELQGTALDWAVAKCEDKQGKGLDWTPPAYSTDWAQGGPIIEREKIQLSAGAVGIWGAFIEHSTKDFLYHGPTPLIASMRCYVASKLGDEVEIPEAAK
jgi:hypothetical protein